MTLADVPMVGLLEPLCFPAPWPAETYRNELRHNQYSAYFVLRPGPGSASELPSVLAYGGYWLMGDEAHIVTLATHPDFRRQGLGEQFLVGLVAASQERRRSFGDAGSARQQYGCPGALCQMGFPVRGASPRLLSGQRRRRTVDDAVFWGHPTNSDPPTSG